MEENFTFTAVINRLNLFLASVKMSRFQFSQTVGIKKTTFEKIMTEDRDFRVGVILSISSTFPQLNVDWLLTGRGNMYIDGSSSVSNSVIISHSDNNSNISNNNEQLVEHLKSENERLHSALSAAQEHITKLLDKLA